MGCTVFQFSSDDKAVHVFGVWPLGRDILWEFFLFCFISLYMSVVKSGVLYLGVCEKAGRNKRIQISVC